MLTKLKLLPVDVPTVPTLLFCKNTIPVVLALSVLAATTTGAIALVPIFPEFDVITTLFPVTTPFGTPFVTIEVMVPVPFADKVTVPDSFIFDPITIPPLVGSDIAIVRLVPLINPVVVTTPDFALLFIVRSVTVEVAILNGVTVELTVSVPGRNTDSTFAAAGLMVLLPNPPLPAPSVRLVTPGKLNDVRPVMLLVAPVARSTKVAGKIEGRNVPRLRTPAFAVLTSVREPLTDGVSGADNVTLAPVKLTAVPPTMVPAVTEPPTFTVKFFVPNVIV